MLITKILLLIFKKDHDLDYNNMRTYENNFHFIWKNSKIYVQFVGNLNNKS